MTHDASENTDRENLRLLMRALRKKGAFARMGFHFYPSDANFRAHMDSHPGQPLVYCTKQALANAFGEYDEMVWYKLYLTFGVRRPDNVGAFSKEHKQAVRGVAHLIISTAEELGIPNIDWADDIGTCVAMMPRPERHDC
jgi:hypothetical protein